MTTTKPHRRAPPLGANQRHGGLRAAASPMALAAARAATRRVATVSLDVVGTKAIEAEADQISKDWLGLRRGGPATPAAMAMDLAEPIRVRLR